MWEGDGPRWLERGPSEGTALMYLMPRAVFRRRDVCTGLAVLAVQVGRAQSMAGWAASWRMSCCGRKLGM